MYIAQTPQTPPSFRSSPYTSSASYSTNPVNQGSVLTPIPQSAILVQVQTVNSQQFIYQESAPTRFPITRRKSLLSELLAESKSRESLTNLSRHEDLPKPHTLEVSKPCTDLLYLFEPESLVDPTNGIISPVISGETASFVDGYVDQDLSEPSHEADQTGYQDISDAASETETTLQNPSGKEPDQNQLEPPSAAKLWRLHWQPDTSRTQCSFCHKPFTTLRRRHHCRSCGDLYCGNCARGIAWVQVTRTGLHTMDEKKFQIDIVVSSSKEALTGFNLTDLEPPRQTTGPQLGRICAHCHYAHRLGPESWIDYKDGVNGLAIKAMETGWHLWSAFKTAVGM